LKPDLINGVNLDDDACAHRASLARPGCDWNSSTDSSQALSTRDLIFSLHHAKLDRLWHWQAAATMLPHPL
jgi:hypothetical protein